MKELGEALKAIFDKVGQFLDLFDLSFFISGFSVVAALTLLGAYVGWQIPVPLPGWMFTAVAIMTVYIAGMICFAVGRFLRKGGQKVAGMGERERVLKLLIEAHGLEKQEPFRTYLRLQAEAKPNSTAKLSDPLWALYTRLWAQIRHQPELASSLQVLNRYWVMAATYDGVACSMMVWMVVLPFFGFRMSPVQPLYHWSVGFGLSVVVLLVLLGCFREAGRYSMHQVGELMATVAANTKKPFSQGEESDEAGESK